MSYETLRIEREGRVATLWLDRPERMNSLDSVMREELPRAWRELNEDDSVWVVIVTGAGDRAFCTGMDLREPPKRRSPDEPIPRVRLTALDNDVNKPVITAVNGVCAGGGLVFVADSDINLCSYAAYFTDARAGAGQVSIAGTLRLARRIPLEAVFRMVMLGKAEKVAPDRALGMGLVSEVVAPAELLPRARQLAHAIASNSPNAVAQSRRAIWESLDMGLNDALEMGWRVVSDFPRTHDDAQEGARAFAEKRPPNWRYRPARDD